MDSNFEQFRGKKIELPETLDVSGNDYTSYRDGTLEFEQYNYDPNCRYVLNLQVDTEDRIVDLDIDTVYETVYSGEYAECEEEIERDPEDGDYEYLIEAIEEMIIDD